MAIQDLISGLSDAIDQYPKGMVEITIGTEHLAAPLGDSDLGLNPEEIWGFLVTVINRGPIIMHNTKVRIERSQFATVGYAQLKADPRADPPQWEELERTRNWTKWVDEGRLPLPSAYGQDAVSEGIDVLPTKIQEDPPGTRYGVFYANLELATTDADGADQIETLFTVHIDSFDVDLQNVSAGEPVSGSDASTPYDNRVHVD